jgi:hypothetical protein
VRSNPNNSTSEADQTRRIVVAHSGRRPPAVEAERRTASLDTDIVALTAYVDELGAHVNRKG